MRGSDISISIVPWTLLLTALAAYGQDGRGNYSPNPEQEAALGARVAQGVILRSNKLESVAALQYAGRIGRDLAVHLPASGLDYKLEILTETGASLHEPAVLPGGYLLIPARLFLAAEDEAEFAGMLAHSMAHAAARHGVLRATDNAILSVAIPLIYVGIHGSGTAVPLGLLDVLRGYELDADRLGAQTMARAGYDPAALVRYIERMDSGGPDKRFSPLPPREARLANLRQAVTGLSISGRLAGADSLDRIRQEVRGLMDSPAPAPSLR